MMEQVKQHSAQAVTPEALAAWGGPNLVYVRRVAVPGGSAWGIFAQSGQPMGVTEERDLALRLRARTNSNRSTSTERATGAGWSGRASHVVAQLDRCSPLPAAGNEIQDFHHHGEAHRGVDVALRNMDAETIRDESRPDQEQEGQSQHLHRRVVRYEVRQDRQRPP